MARHFNVAGPCDPEIHYMIPAERRLQDVKPLIETRAYFVLHAPRQVGKTTSVRTLARDLTASGKYAAVVLSVQPGRAFGTDIGAAEQAILGEWRFASSNALPPELRPPNWPAWVPGNAVRGALSTWASTCPRPLVVFIDEIDALEGEALRSILSQLRSGHPELMMAFMQTVANGGGRLEREYAAGSGRLDLYLEVRDTKIAIELKVWRPDEPDPLDDGLEQIDEYLATLSPDKGWLVIFDRRPDQPRLAQRTTSGAVQTPRGREVIVIRA